MAIRVFWLPAHGCLALSSSEIPSLGRIYGPAASQLRLSAPCQELSCHTPHSASEPPSSSQAIQCLLLQKKVRKNPDSFQLCKDHFRPHLHPSLS